MEENKVVNVQDIWLDVKTVALLKGITERAVRLQKNKYINKKSGGSIRILLSSLEAELQEKYLSDYYKKLVFEEAKQELTIIEPRFQSEFNKETPVNKKQKTLALARLDLLKQWEEFRKQEKSKSDANKRFLELYNTGEFYPDIYNKLGKASIGSLYRWKTQLNGSEDWSLLVSGYKYKHTGEYRTTLTDEEIRIFMKLLLNQNRFSIGKAISLTRHILQKRGYEYIPQDITFRRYAKYFKKYNYDKWILAREGQKALKDKVEPFIIRDATLLDVGSVLVADGHKINFQIINPFTGKPNRATLVGFLDWRSGALVGYEIMLEENTQCIASALRSAIINLGRIPDIVYQDNGKAFKAKIFQGNKGFDELGFNGIYRRLGIKPVFAQPYNARAKVIERFFLEFQESFEKLLPSYIGSSIEYKPAYMKRNEKLHKEMHSSYVPTIQEVMRMIDYWLEYKHSQSCPHEKDKSIAEVLASVKKQSIDKNKLDDLMMAQEIKTIGRNGIRFLKCDYYDEVLYGLRDKVVIKYSLFDLSKIKVYSTKGEYLCTASRVEATHPMAEHLGSIKDLEDFKQKVQKPKQLRKRTLNSIKNYMSSDDLKFLESEMEQDYIDGLETKISNTKEIELKKAEQEEIAPLVFKNNFEKYDHLRTMQELSNDEKSWINWYEQTDEYKEMYE